MHASFYRTSLYCTLQILCSFTGWSSVATLWSSKSKGTIFPRALANFKSLSHFGNSGNISNFLMTIIFATVICDRWSVITANTFRILQTALQPIGVLWPTSCQYLHLCDRVPLLYPRLKIRDSCATCLYRNPQGLSNSSTHTQLRITPSQVKPNYQLSRVGAPSAK